MGTHQGKKRASTPRAARRAFRRRTSALTAAVFVFARGDLYRWLKTWVYWGINLEWYLPSGKLTVCDIENGPVEIVSFPALRMVMFHSYVSLPEGK